MKPMNKKMPAPSGDSGAIETPGSIVLMPAG